MADNVTVQDITVVESIQQPSGAERQVVTIGSVGRTGSEVTSQSDGMVVGGDVLQELLNLLRSIDLRLKELPLYLNIGASNTDEYQSFRDDPRNSTLSN